ncbi:MAG: acyl--CoA ligase, partial [Calditrichaeota bacterium]|nr:acyl--CoA ligase [Calditrichota bacterium]
MNPNQLDRLTLPAIFEYNSSKDAARPIFFDLNGQPLTFAIFYNRVELLSEMLAKQEIKKGDRIAILSDNIANWAIAYFAIASRGAVAVPVISDFSDGEIENILKQTEAVSVFVSQTQIPRISKIQTKHLRFFVHLENFKIEKIKKSKEPVPELIEREFGKIKKATLGFMGRPSVGESETVDEEDLAQIFYFPDESGQLKGVRLSQKNIVFTSQSAVRSLDLNSDTKIMVLLPLASTLACTLSIIAPLLVRSQVVFVNPPDSPETFNQWLRQFKPTHILADVNFINWLNKSLSASAQSSSIIKNSLRFVGRLFNRFLKKEAPPENKLFKNYRWLISANFHPPGQKLKTLLKKQSADHRFLFGLIETSSLFIAGRPTTDFCWIQGDLLPN